MRLIYIAGASRSGSTLLERLLGHVQGVVSVGEVVHLWTRGLQQDWFCGCGEPVARCPFWTQVMDRVEADVGRVDPEMMDAALRKVSRNSMVPLYLLPAARRALLSGIQRQLKVLVHLYQAIAWAASSQVVVDSSKNAGYGMLLNSLAEIEVSCVHLVRDPRATVYSWSRSKHGAGLPNDHSMPTKGTGESSLEWLRFTVGADILAAQASGGGVRIRYEDFTREPESELRAALSLVGKEAVELKFLQGAQAQLDATHSVSGNPDRMTQMGEVEIRNRSEWREGLSDRDRLLVHALTWPQMLRYGYPLRNSIQSEHESMGMGGS